jgi:hypothetical protein
MDYRDNPQRSPKNDPAAEKVRILTATYNIDTLVCTRGPNFPLSRLESRLMCPACGSRRVTVVFEPPSNYQVGTV